VLEFPAELSLPFLSSILIDDPKLPGWRRGLQDTDDSVDECASSRSSSPTGLTAGTETRSITAMSGRKTTDVVVTCPCCEAQLTIDPKLGKIIAHEAPPRHSNAPDLDKAAALLREQAARREALFKQSTEDVKMKSQLLERKFAAALEKNKDEPVTRPTRDIDLD
jgi:hypothetical protein